MNKNGKEKRFEAGVLFFIQNRIIILSRDKMIMYIITAEDNLYLCRLAGSELLYFLIS